MSLLLHVSSVSCVSREPRKCPFAQSTQCPVLRAWCSSSSNCNTKKSTTMRNYPTARPTNNATTQPPSNGGDQNGCTSFFGQVETLAAGKQGYGRMSLLIRKRGMPVGVRVRDSFRRRIFDYIRGNCLGRSTGPLYAHRHRSWDSKGK
jgi:hypothetical protein